MLAPIGPNHGMREPIELGQRHALADLRVLFAHQADVGCHKQFLLKEARPLQIGKVAHGQLGQTGFQAMRRSLIDIGMLKP